jgi:hypothetical protein
MQQSADGQIITLAWQRNGGVLTLVPFHSSRFSIAFEEGKELFFPCCLCRNKKQLQKSNSCTPAPFYARKSLASETVA